MTKRILICVLLCLLFVTCKKDKKVVTYNVNGNWTLYSYQHNFQGGLDASVTQYPCMGANILKFNTDATASLAYSGTDTCFITASHIKGKDQIFGFPGQVPIQYNWSARGNILHLTTTDNSIYGTITSINTKLLLTLRDTVVSGANTYYVTTVLTK